MAFEICRNSGERLRESSENVRSSHFRIDAILPVGSQSPKRIVLTGPLLGPMAKGGPHETSALVFYCRSSVLDFNSRLRSRRSGFGRGGYGARGAACRAQKSK